MESVFLETERLYLRQMTNEDFEDVAQMLQDSEVMQAWEYTFEDIDVLAWIKKNREYYKKYGLGYFLIVDKSINEIVGQAALMPDIIAGKEYYEIGYILKRKFRKKGYATEAAKELADYAFNNLDVNFVIFEIRPENKNSRAVAERLGATEDGSFEKNVRGQMMKHLIYKLFMIN